MTQVEVVAAWINKGKLAASASLPAVRGVDMHWRQLVILHINLLPDMGDPLQLTQELIWTTLYACTQTLTPKDTESACAAQTEGPPAAVYCSKMGEEVVTQSLVDTSECLTGTVIVHVCSPMHPGRSSGGSLTKTSCRGSASSAVREGPHQQRLLFEHQQERAHHAAQGGSGAESASSEQQET